MHFLKSKKPYSQVTPTRTACVSNVIFAVQINQRVFSTRKNSTQASRSKKQTLNRRQKRLKVGISNDAIERDWTHSNVIKDRAYGSYWKRLKRFLVGCGVAGARDDWNGSKSFECNWNQSALALGINRLNQVSRLTFFTFTHDTMHKGYKVQISEQIRILEAIFTLACFTHWKKNEFFMIFYIFD